MTSAWKLVTALLSLGLVGLGTVQLVHHKTQDALVSFVLYLAIRVSAYEVAHD